jgi:hypothetical protein
VLLVAEEREAGGEEQGGETCEVEDVNDLFPLLAEQ